MAAGSQTLQLLTDMVKPFTLHVPLVVTAGGVKFCSGVWPVCLPLGLSTEGMQDSLLHHSLLYQRNRKEEEVHGLFPMTDVQIAAMGSSPKFLKYWIRIRKICDYII